MKMSVMLFMLFISTFTISAHADNLLDMKLKLQKEIYRDFASNYVGMLSQSPDFVKALTPENCKKWSEHGLNAIDNVGLTAYMQVDDICEAKSAGLADLMESDKTTLSGQMMMPVHYGNDLISNLTLMQDNYLNNLKVNGIPTANECEATITVMPGASDLTKHPLAIIGLGDIHCGLVVLYPWQIARKTVTLNCDQYRFKNSFMKKYFSYFDRCEKYSVPNEISFDNVTYHVGSIWSPEN